MSANGSLKDILVDAAIAGGSAAAGVGVGMAFADVRAEPGTFLWAAGIAFAVAFFASLRAARNRPSEPEDPA